jgi:hypothetical protein
MAETCSLPKWRLLIFPVPLDELVDGETETPAQAEVPIANATPESVALVTNSRRPRVPEKSELKFDSCLSLSMNYP